MQVEFHVINVHCEINLQELKFESTYRDLTLLEINPDQVFRSEH